MEIIKPSEISGKIMSLIEDAEKFVVVVSPYYKLSRWEKLIKKIEAAKRKGIEFTFFIRKPECHEDYKCIEEVERIGYTPIAVERLHAKIYLNDTEAIISSMNLNVSSDTASLDIAVKTQTSEEYAEVYKFYEKYIKIHQNLESFFCEDSFIMNVHFAVEEIFTRKASVSLDEGSLYINGNNRYTAFIFKDGNALKINCILSGKEFDYLNENSTIFKNNKLWIELHKGGKGFYDQIWGTLLNIKSNSLHEILENEADEITDTIIGFVKRIEQMKNFVQEQVDF